MKLLHRARKYGARRWLAHLAVLGILVYGVPRFATDAYDYAVLAPCRNEIVGAMAEYYETPAPDTADLSAKAKGLLPAEYRLRDRVANAWCPSHLTDEKAAFVAAMDERIAALEFTATTGQLDMYMLYKSTGELREAHEALYGELGEPLP